MILGKLIKCWREAEDKSLRTLANEIGMDYTALHRLEQGEDLSGVNLCKVIVWLLTPNKETNVR